MTDHIVQPELLALMQCPVCAGALRESVEARALVCISCGRTYPVDEHGIPNMVVEDAAAD
jgi:uncharacterized protein YbaR (Trm112 family)